MKSARESRRRGSLPKAFDGMDQHNAWDFETQYKQTFQTKSLKTLN
jgi:hypothetical protein